MARIINAHNTNVMAYNDDSDRINRKYNFSTSSSWIVEYGIKNNYCQTPGET